MTGINPRRVPVPSESKPEVKWVRMAQRYWLSMITGVEVPEYETAMKYEETKDTFQLLDKPLDYSHLSAAVGHLDTKTMNGSRQLKLVVILPTQMESDYAVMKKPGPRDPKNMDYYAVSDDAKQQAIEEVHELKEINIAGYSLPLGQTASYDVELESWMVHHEDWEHKSRTWEERRIEVIKEWTVPVLMWSEAKEAINWKMPEILDAATRLSFHPQRGVVKDWNTTWLPALAKRYGHTHLSRALAWICGQWISITIPVLGLDNKRDEKQFMPMEHDGISFQFMLHLSLYLPGVFALDRAKLPSFRILDSQLLRRLEVAITRLVRIVPVKINKVPLVAVKKGSKQKSNPTCWEDTWKETPPALDPESDQVLKPHQRSVLTRMIDNMTEYPEITAHLLNAECSFGKARVCALLVHHLLKNGNLPDIVLWTMPNKGVMIKNMMNELKKSTGAPVHNATSDGVLRPYHINVVDRAFLRTHRETVMQQAPRIYPVYDEIDTFFPTSIMSSCALELARLCPGLLGATATLIPDGRLSHLPWLQLFVKHIPVTSKNWLVATQYLFREHYDTGLKRVEEEIDIPFPHHDRVFCDKLESLCRDKKGHDAFKLVLSEMNKHIVTFSQKVLFVFFVSTCLIEM